MSDPEKRTAVCTFNVEPSLKAAFYDGLRARGLSATFLFRRLMQENVKEWCAEGAQEENVK